MFGKRNKQEGETAGSTGSTGSTAADKPVETPVTEAEEDSLAKKLKGYSTAPLQDEEPSQQERTKSGPNEFEAPGDNLTKSGLLGFGGGDSS